MVAKTIVIIIICNIATSKNFMTTGETRIEETYVMTTEETNVMTSEDTNVMISEDTIVMTTETEETTLPKKVCPVPPFESYDTHEYNYIGKKYLAFSLLAEPFTAPKYCCRKRYRNSYNTVLKCNRVMIDSKKIYSKRELFFDGLYFKRTESSRDYIHFFKSDNRGKKKASLVLVYDGAGKLREGTIRRINRKFRYFIDQCDDAYVLKLEKVSSFRG